jgi:RNA polymerase sigma factor (sigma-70 family)
MTIIKADMPKFRIDTLGELACQMRFTPQETRSAQLDSAENLLFQIDPAKAYPADFIIFRITGYHPRQVKADLLTGLALQHDLGLLIELVSDSLDVRTADLAEPVLQIEDVCERFNVTSKTIQRWRRKGLPARRFIFPDGKRRVGFLLHSVERFFSQNRDQVQRGGNFSQVEDAEREDILRRARRLAVQCRCCQHEIARRIARKLNRSPVTVLHTIRKHDEEHPDQAIFAQAAQPLSADDRAVILRGYRRGVSIRAMARRLARPRSAVYRVLLEERVEKLSRRKVRFIDDPLFHGPGAEEAIDAIVDQQPLPSADEHAAEALRIPRDLPPYFASLYRTPLLTPAQERGLFLRLNFRKYQFVQARRRLDPQFARARDLNLLEGLLRRIHETRNQIVAANLRLVVSVARKHLRPGLQLMELVSEGNLVLMRAVDGFNVSRGHRFSTYATLALMKGFARSVPQLLQRGRAALPGDAVLETLADPAPPAGTRRLVARDELRKLLASLDARERDVLLAHWGVGDREASYDQLGAELGLSRQRIRQIEQSALQKLRAVAQADAQ